MCQFIAAFKKICSVPAVSNLYSEIPQQIFAL